MINHLPKRMKKGYYINNTLHNILLKTNQEEYYG